LWVNFGIRAAVEAQDRTVGLFIDYDELLRLVDGSPDFEFSDILSKAYGAGATGLIVRERILAEWEITGDILVLSGKQLIFQIENQSTDNVSDATAGTQVVPTKTYILTRDPLIYSQLYSLLDAKGRNPEPYEYPGYMVIACQLHSSERANMGVGFPLAHLEEAAAAGFEIIPRLRNWEPFTEESLAEVFRWVAMIPSLAAIGFNDLTVPGEGNDPDRQDDLAAAIKPLGKPLVSFEFYDQTGLPGLAARLDNQLLRAHTISEGELRRFSDSQGIIDRFSLAATERNIRYIYIRFQGLINPGASINDNIKLIADIRDELLDEGLIVGNPKPIQPFSISWVLRFLLGIGVIVAGGWLIALGAKPHAKKSWLLPYTVLIGFGCLVWAGLTYISPTLSRKLLALAGAIVFPSLSVLLVLAWNDRGADRLDAKVKTQSSQLVFSGKRLISSVVQLFIMSALTFVGAMIMSAILSGPTFMLKLDSFFGVKVSHVIPLFVVLCILLLWEENWLGILTGTAKSNVRYWQLAIGIVIAAGFIFYISRTGNENPGAVSDFELSVRQLLNNILGVRPRTTEFLIGHPLMLVLLYFGCKLNKFPLLMIGIMGQISLINTYAHIHTPMLVSLQRSGHGLWIGTLIGIIAIFILLWGLRRLLAFHDKHAKTAAGE